MSTNYMIPGWSPGTVMSPEQIKILYERLYYEVWNRGNLNAVQLLYPSDIKSFHIPGAPWSTQNIVSPEQIITMCRNAVPDLFVSIEEQTLDRDSLVTRWTAVGTHTGPLLTIPPTNKPVKVTGTTIRHLFFDYEGRALTGEMWVNWDTSSTNGNQHGPEVIQRCLIKAGEVDNFHGLFYAETVDGRFQIAHTDKTFSGPPSFPMGDKKEALEELVNKLQAAGWQQVVGKAPSPWYQLTFQRQRAPGEWNTSSMNETAIRPDAESETPSNAMQGMFGLDEPMHGMPGRAEEIRKKYQAEMEARMQRMKESLRHGISG